jgi:NAD(P)-dependent dehydrogenase (short-subunit alcohol dehydrogenase family)
MADTFDFTGKVVLVTGVGRVGQIGYAVAEGFGRAGAKLVISDISAVNVAARAREFNEQGIEARAAAGDLTEPDVASGQWMRRCRRTVASTSWPTSPAASRAWGR